METENLVSEKKKAKKKLITGIIMWIGGAIFGTISKFIFSISNNFGMEILFGIIYLIWAVICIWGLVWIIMAIVKLISLRNKGEIRIARRAK